MAGFTPNSEKQAMPRSPRHPLHSALMGAAMGTAGGGIIAPKGKLLKYMLGGAAGGGAIGGAMGLGQNLGSAAGDAISRGTGMDEKGNAAAATQIAARLAGLGGGAYLGLKAHMRIGEELDLIDEPKKKEKEAMSLYSFGAKLANYVDLHDSPSSDELISRAKDVKNEAERTGRPVVKDYAKKQLSPHEVFQNALRRAEASGEKPSADLFSRMQKEHDSAQKKAQSACSPCAMPNGPAKKPYTSASPAVTDAGQKSEEIGKPPVAKTEHSAAKAKLPEEGVKSARTKQANPLLKMLGQAGAKFMGTAAKAKPPVAPVAGAAGAGAAAAQAAGKIKITPADLAARAAANPKQTILPGSFAATGMNQARTTAAANPHYQPAGGPIKMAPPAGAAPAVRPAAPPSPPNKVTISPAEAAAGRAKVTITPQDLAARAQATAELNPQQAGHMSQLWQDGTSEFRRKALGLGQSANAPEVMRKFEQLSPAQQQQFYGHYKGGSAMAFGVKVADATDELFQAGRNMTPPIKSAPNPRYATENVNAGAPDAAAAFDAQRATKLPSPNMAPPPPGPGGASKFVSKLLGQLKTVGTGVNNARLSAGGQLGESYAAGGDDGGRGYQGPPGSTPQVSGKVGPKPGTSSKAAPTSGWAKAKPVRSSLTRGDDPFGDKVKPTKPDASNMLGDAMGFLSKNKYPIGAGVGAAGLAALLYNMNRKPKKKKQDEDDDA